MTQRFIGVFGFDASAKGEEIQKIIHALTQTGYNLEIIKDPREMVPEWSRWQIKVSVDVQGSEV